MNTDQTAFVSLRSAAYTLGVPAAWLKREAKAGRVPCLFAGRQLRFNVGAVRDALERRAAVGTSAEAHA